MSLYHFVLCVRVPITLAPEILRCGSDRGNDRDLIPVNASQTLATGHEIYTQVA